MKKDKSQLIYFTQTDQKILNQLAQKRNESKSAVVRKLINIEKYEKILQQIETNNQIIADFLKEFTHLGINLNQIAYQLNIATANETELKNDLEKNIKKITIEIKKLKIEIKEMKFKINIHTKTPTKKVTNE